MKKLSILFLALFLSGCDDLSTPGGAMATLFESIKNVDTDQFASATNSCSAFGSRYGSKAGLTKLRGELAGYEKVEQGLYDLVFDDRDSPTGSWRYTSCDTQGWDIPVLARRKGESALSLVKIAYVSCAARCIDESHNHCVVYELREPNESSEYHR